MKGTISDLTQCVRKVFSLTAQSARQAPNQESQSGINLRVISLIIISEINAEKHDVFKEI
jgi:hypothetical protein